MAKGVFHAELNSSTHKLSVKLELYKFKEDNAFIMYCPALDLSTSGKSEEEAEQSFSETFQIYINYCIHKRTLVEDLQKNGWDVRSMKQRKMKAPDTKKLLSINETLREIVYNRNYEKTSRSVEIPQFV
ncbi:MAG: hypothetical protein Q7J05_04130 [Paludibacter sp.]|jgi:predicted RNase H-like HicB family nuclease|nr:hypothetical protein [Paludibacter sp.]